MSCPHHGLDDLIAPSLTWADSCLPELAEVPLLDAERSCYPDARPPRQREFALGRRVARRAARALGLPDRPLLPGPDRAPRWPAGVQGSLAHTEDYAVAVLGSARAYQGIGIDVEVDRSLEAELWPEICTPGELRVAASTEDPGRQALLCFAAKEAVYKAQQPLTGSFLEFGDLELEFQFTTRSFVAGPTRPREDLELLQRLQGSWSVCGGCLFVLTFIPN